MSDYFATAALRAGSRAEEEANTEIEMWRRMYLRDVTEAYKEAKR